MKAFLAAIFMFVLGDYAINHGDATHQALVFGRSFIAWLSHTGTESVFNQ